MKMNISKWDAHHKLYGSIALAIIVFFISMGRFSGSVHFMLTWLSYSLSSLTLAWITILNSHPADVKVEAHDQDSSRTLVFIFAVAAAFASLFAILILLQSAGGQSKQQLSLHVLISLACVVASWSLIHTIFTLRYAHFYYCDMDGGDEGKDLKPGGLEFPGETEPDYLDFAYFSFVIGMTFQVSDVQITSKRIRRLALMHAILSFAFNTIIVALSINIISGLIGK
jgi:uncharacterized membrane protein